MQLETDDFLKDILRWKKFFIYEKKILERSKNTLEQYERILESFYDYSIEHEEYMKFSSVNKQYLLNFLIWKEENSAKDISASSKHSYITILKSFLKYISDNNDEEINLMKKIKGLTVSIPKREPKGLNEDEITLLNIYLNDLLEKDARTHKGKIINFRNSLIIKILLNGGLRVSEVIGLKFSDIEKLAKENVFKLTIIGKGNKERYGYIETHIIENEINFLIENKMEFVAETKPGNVIDRKNLHKMLSTIYTKAGLENKSGIHILRHTFAQNLVINNTNLSTIQDLMGHSNIQTTMIYARTNEKNKIEAIKKRAE